MRLRQRVQTRSQRACVKEDARVRNCFPLLGGVLAAGLALALFGSGLKPRLASNKEAIFLCACCGTLSVCVPFKFLYYRLVLNGAVGFYSE